MDQTHIVHDARKNAYAQRLFYEAGLKSSGAFIRIPLETTDRYNLVLVLLGSTPIPKPTQRKLSLISEVGGLVKEHLKSTVELLVDPDKHVTVARRLDDIKAMIQPMPQAMYLLDAKLQIIATNAPGAKMINVSPEKLNGLTHRDIAPETADSVHFLYNYALKTMRTPPYYEIIIEGVAPRIFRLNVTPFSPIETFDNFLLVNVEETTDFEARSRAIAKVVDRGRTITPPKDPSQIFLMDTLVRRRTIRQRKQTSYVVLRAWRQTIKPYQITALKALKQNIPSEFALEIATEILGEIESLFGIAGFKAIVPMPCGHSKGESCLSLEIARALGLITGLPVIQAFISEPIQGVSHPKENAKRPPMKMTRIITEPVLLIDDVVTSGAHIEEAVSLLKPTCGAVLPIAWLGGDVSEKAAE